MVPWMLFLRKRVTTTCAPVHTLLLELKTVVMALVQSIIFSLREKVTVTSIKIT
jgi:hypothetical protein